MNNLKGKIGLMAASLPMMSFLAPSSILARVAESYPDASLQLVQMLTTVPNVISVIVSILIGFLTPYVYKKYLILISGLIYPVTGTLIFFFHPNVMTMVVLTALMGIGSGIRITCIPALICDCYNEKESGQLIGMQAGFISGGAMLFIWIGGQLARNNWEYCYLGYLFIFILLIVELFCLPKGKLDRKKETHEQKAAIPKSILFFTVTTFAFCIFIYVFNSNVSLLVDMRSMGGTVETSYASMCYNLAGMVAGCITGFVITKVKEHIFSCGIFLGLMGSLLCFIAPNLGILCIGGILCGAAFAVVVPAGNYFASINSADYNRTFCISLFNAGSALGQFFSPLFFGATMGSAPIDLRFAAAASGLFVLLIIMIVGNFKIRKASKL